MATDTNWLLQRSQIIDLLSVYATGLDARDWPLWRSVFVDEVVFDLSSWNDQLPKLLNTDRVVATQARLFAEFTMTQHLIANHRVVIDGDQARALAHMRAEHWLDESRYTMFGYYDDKLVRTPEGWKISQMQLKVTHTEGDLWVMEEARRRMQAKRRQT